VVEDPVTALWCALHDLCSRHGLSSREIAASARKAAVLRPAELCAHNSVNKTRNVAKAVARAVRGGSPVPPEFRVAGAKPPSRAGLLTIVAGIDHSQLSDFRDLLFKAEEYVEEAADARAAHPPPAPVYDFAATLAERVGGSLQAFRAVADPVTVWRAVQKVVVPGTAPRHLTIAYSPEDFRIDEELHDVLRGELTNAIAALTGSRPLVDLTVRASIEVGVFGVDDADQKDAWGGPPGYRDLEVINKSANSIVYRAVQARLHRYVAIKVLLIDGVATTEDDFRRELSSIVRLSTQPHIVGVIDADISPTGEPYIVMEYCPGGSYEQIVSDHGPLPVAEVLHIGTAIGNALHSAHSAGIIHRDVKPSNILRSEFGPALADFGIARTQRELARPGGNHSLTPSHASPEAWQGLAESASSDVYSLASSLWHLLAGHPPFAYPDRPAPDLEELRRRVLADPAGRVPRPDVPEWLHDELTRALAKDPADRRQTARLFAEALDDPARTPPSGMQWPLGPTSARDD
jgi:hypothetical protein